MTLVFASLVALLSSVAISAHDDQCIGFDCVQGGSEGEAESQTVSLLQQKMEVKTGKLHKSQGDDHVLNGADPIMDDFDEDRHELDTYQLMDGGKVETDLGNGVSGLFPASSTNLLDEVKQRVNSSEVSSLLQMRANRTTASCPPVEFNVGATGYTCGPSEYRAYVDAWVTEPACYIITQVLWHGWVSSYYYWRANPSLTADGNYGWCRGCIEGFPSFYTSGNPWTVYNCGIR
jgi:hypothetical protein